MRNETAATIARVRDLLGQADCLLNGVMGDSHPEDLKDAEDIERLQEVVYAAMLDASRIVEP